MIFNNDLLQQKARELALKHDTRPALRSAARLRTKFNADVESLRSFVRSLQEGHGHCSQPAEEWLLDNAEFIEEQELTVREELSGSVLRRLPSLRKSGELRIESVCADYLEQVDGVVDVESFMVYIQAYQEVSVLTVAEVWIIPLMLRVSLTSRLAAEMELVRERREVCVEVQRFLERLEPARIDPEQLKTALDEAGQDIPLAGSWIVHLVSHLREWAEDASVVREWLICKLENGSENLERIVSYEHQLQSGFQVTAGHLISSFRTVERWNWRETFERICLVEQTLRKDGTGVYSLLDDSSRDIIRKRVEEIAYRLRVPENLVAKQAVELAQAELAKKEPDVLSTATDEAPMEGTRTNSGSSGCKAHPKSVVEIRERAGNLADDTENLTDEPPVNPADPPADHLVGELPPRRTFVAYYLLEPAGIKQLRRALAICSDTRLGPRRAGAVRRETGTYFSWLSILFAVVLIGFSAWVGAGRVLQPIHWFWIVLAMALPASEWAVTAVHWLIERLTRPRPLLRYDFSAGVSREASTMVVIPVIWSSPEEAEELVDRLELHYLANRDPNIHFALLGDFTDTDTETTPQDQKIVDRARAKIEKLNQTYSGEDGTTFHLYQRRRQWNPSEGVWMGWERKRGKLVEFVELLQGSKDTSYQFVFGQASVLERIRYIITLDTDTQLPMGSAQRMIGTMHLPYNQPRLNDTRTRVVEGYGVLQPRIGISHEAAMSSRLAYLWSGDPGIDPYSFAASDPYQDGLGQGIFTGKGIFDVGTFQQVLCERIPDNHVLSHDLLEGGFLRAGLLSDIELIDDYPSTFRSYQLRLHRWVRGDWQLVCWLFPRICDRRGMLQPIDLSALTRWQIIDNLRRSLVPPGLFLLLLLGMTVLPGASGRWLIVALITLLLPAARQLITGLGQGWNPRGLVSSIGQSLLTIWTLPYQTVVLVDAALKSVYRLYVSKKRLLEWVSSAEIERRNQGKNGTEIVGLGGGIALIVLFAAASVASNDLGMMSAGLVLCVLWALAPFGVRWLDRPPHRAIPRFTQEEERQLRILAKQIWSYFEDFAGPQDNWLPPDNIQIEPPNGAAHRTSPTNIGFLLTCTLAARDFGFIDTRGMIERMERTVGTIERMDKWHGHLYNWYDTVSLAPLPPLYVSTVDSGNFVACLMTVKEGLAEWLRTEFRMQDIPDRTISNHVHGASVEEREEAGVSRRGLMAMEEFAVEIEPREPTPEKLPPVQGESPDPTEETPKGDQERSSEHSEEWAARGNELINRLAKLIDETDFRPLYDHKAKLFALGYHADTGVRETILYDLLASEARQASFVAIALGQVSVSHWFALGRTMTKLGKEAALISWSGTMFEYMMPWLIMRTYPNTIWERTYRGIIDKQIEYAHKRGVPFGISESGYYAYDYQMNYQYRAFGVPGLGFKRGLEQDLVLAPYATIMALPYAANQGLEDLRRMEELGARGKYGFYEAIDYTRERMPRDREFIVIRSFMAHHQGMSLLTLANLLLPHKMYDRFHSDKRVQAAELLLKERAPLRPKIMERLVMERTPPETKLESVAPLREYSSPDTPAPEVCVLSNGAYTTVVTNSGSGFSRIGPIAVSRWREDPAADDWGSYIYVRDVAEDEVWSATYQPCRGPSDEQQAQFMLEKAVFTRENQQMRTQLEICVSPETNAEIRRLTLTNQGKETRTLEVTTFLELVLAPPAADDAHPAFSKLFVQTEYSPEAECLLAQRRPRDGGEQTMWAVHALMASRPDRGSLEYETDRVRFIGRGHTLSDPQEIRTRLSGTLGAVADPAFVMRRQVTLEPGQRMQLHAVTGVADTREEAIGIVKRLNQEHSVERTFQLAWTRAQIELRHLHLKAVDTALFQTLAGRALYRSHLDAERARRIADNTKGQSGLWAHGISGDRPIVLVRIEDAAHLSFVSRLIMGHEYLGRLGLPLDLVILNESLGGYHQDLQEAIQRTAEQRTDPYGSSPGTLSIIAANQLPEADKTLLLAAAKVVLNAGGPSLKAQLRRAGAPAGLPGPLVASREEQRTVEPAGQPAVGSVSKATVRPSAEEPQSLSMFNGWGGFSPDGREYRIVVKNGNHLPAPWINVMANPGFGTLMSELHTGYTWWRNSRECKLTPWSNDPVIDRPGEICYLRDEERGEFWQVPHFRTDSASSHTVSHGRGYTRYHQESHGLDQEMTVFVPLDDPVKVIRLRLKNRTEEKRRLSVTYYAEWVLGVQREANASFVVTEWNDRHDALFARNTYQESFREATAFLTMVRQKGKGTDPSDASKQRTHSGTSAPELCWTSDRAEFFGRFGTPDHPAAMSRSCLSGRTGTGHDTCGALQAKLSIEPQGEQTVYILLGCGESRESGAQLIQKYSKAAECEEALTQVQAFWDRVLGQIQVSSPSPEMDLMVNSWLLYQSLSCRMWARTAFYQAGGAYGFRDQLQDSLSLLHSLPHLTRAQIILHASHQYIEGDVQHWWHEETERGIRTRFSDDLLWLPYSVTRYLEHTGDDSILEETAPYLRSEPLGEDEHERYEVTVTSEESGTIYDHCLRAIERSLRFGEHGLPLIGIGDWNDGLSRVGAEGRGESVWLGWFICYILDRFAELCERRGDSARAERYREVRSSLAASLNDHAWDGQWYRRAFTDAGQWLGSVHNVECRIDAIAQSWSVISGAGEADKARRAMQSFDRNLVDRSLSVVSLLTPPFDRTDPSPGYIQGYPPGIRENGAQYTHGVLWSIFAWCQLGNGDKAFELFHMLNPITHTRTPGEVRRYVGEPYVMSADVYTTDPHKGHAGWTWYTGAAGWMYQACIEGILGLLRRGERLYVRPCIPSEWPELAIQYRFGDTMYRITILNPERKSQGLTGWSVDGEEQPLTERSEEEGAVVELRDDGQEHTVVLTL
ncbi:GH36-type glycosyl hydrolase domain-containing protein [Paenibacillus sp. J2TS4]|uniref:GH36-type glycosyl hydrolase domain-containing protein n=1 Tax=Paenibacillus sp. J2TS4 TaxID=2807194 RepID=UPI001B24F11B|nr:glucoamylase family protein [Paenibacillus sp. J2TS4]GIP31491.1 glycosyl transferase [Paenibacillus sp. J2TS4]